MQDDRGRSGRRRDREGGDGISDRSAYGGGRDGYQRGERYRDERRGYDGGIDYSRHRARDEERGFKDKAADEMSSWFGDDDAERRREIDKRGRGPKNYRRSDTRIEEDVNDRLTDDRHLDAGGIEVSVSDGEVTLSGTVASRYEKRRAEDCADAVSGVTHTQNNLRVTPEEHSGLKGVSGV